VRLAEPDAGVGTAQIALAEEHCLCWLKIC
jgi:hypothetical protein